MPDSTTVGDSYAIAMKDRFPPAFENRKGWGTLVDRFPRSVRELFERHALEETPKSDDRAFVHARWWTILSSAALLEAAGREAMQQGFLVEIDNSCDDWDYASAADHLLGRLRELRSKHERVCLLSGGEVTVHVENGGIGGRNQQFALYCAGKISGKNIAVLSSGSDGIDGDSPAAGAIVDGATVERAKARGLDVAAHLSALNAYPLFEALGDAIITGPTGNNLRDLRILLAY
jgi:hydroxypyruvate reductase